MSLAKDLNPLTNQPSPDIIPSNELWSDEPQLETNLHLRQILILLTCLEWWWRDRHDFFASGNISIYYEKQQIKKKPHKFRGPDFFVVLNTHPKKERKSWVVWEEDNRFPNLIIEVLSKATVKTDKTTKKTFYQDTFKTPEYFWFHPDKLEFAGFRLVNGKYQAIAANDRGWLWSEELGLFLGIHDSQLRYFTREGELVPIPAEQLERELTERELAQQQADAERRERELAQQQLADVEALLARYRERFGELPD